MAHALVGAALATAVRPRRELPVRWWLLAAGSSMLPDADVVGYELGIPYGHVLGHRGLTHSIAFAIAWGVAVAWLAFRGDRWRGARPLLALGLVVATASHGLLDAMTTGGRGVAFLAPFDDARWFLPWRPILVSPIGVDGFFSARGLAILASEARWVVIPAIAVAAAGIVAHGALRPERKVEPSAP
jgi:inner membrane protein